MIKKNFQVTISVYSWLVDPSRFKPIEEMQKEVVEANIELLMNLFFSKCEPSKNQTLALSLKQPVVGQSDLRLAKRLAISCEKSNFFRYYFFAGIFFYGSD